MTDRERGVRKTLVYRGSSMSPTFRELDVLGYRDDVSPKTGDVIAFAVPEHERIIVHRIVRCTPTGFVTQGDNAAPDPGRVLPGAVIGRIDRVNRDGRVRPVRGGGAGLAYARGCHAFRRLRPLLVGLAGPVYRRLVGR